MKMNGGLDVNGEARRSRGPEVIDIPGWIFDHEVRVQRKPGDRPDRPNHERTKGQIWNKVTVHDVKMEPIGAPPFGKADLLFEILEIRRKNRRRDFYHARG